MNDVKSGTLAVKQVCTLFQSQVPKYIPLPLDRWPLEADRRPITVFLEAPGELPARCELSPGCPCLDLSCYPRCALQCESTVCQLRNFLMLSHWKLDSNGLSNIERYISHNKNFGGQAVSELVNLPEKMVIKDSSSCHLIFRILVCPLRVSSPHGPKMAAVAPCFTSQWLE